MASVVTATRGRVDATPLTAAAAVGDLACIGLFVVLGAVQHGTVADLDRVVMTALSFGVGWALASLAVGVYVADVRSARRALVRVAPAWVGAAAVAQVFRSTAPFPGSPQLSFFLVSVGVGLVLLGAWRTVLARVTAG